MKQGARRNTKKSGPNIANLSLGEYFLMFISNIPLFLPYLNYPGLGGLLF